jgi:peptidyl-prolyl cis-trans isomerase C
MKLIASLVALASLLALAACSPTPDNTQSATATTTPTATPSATAFPARDVFMSVNGEAVDRALVLAYIAQRGFDANDPVQLQLAADKLGEFIAIVQAGRADPYAQTPEFAVEQLKSDAALAMQRFASNPPLSDAEVQAGYQAQIAATGGVQLNLQHLMTLDVATAQTIQAALAAGKSFAAVMQEMQGNSSVKENKDWGWTTVISLPEPLREATLALKNGGFTPSAMHLGQQYYFVNVSAAKPFEAPQFETVKDGMRKAMEQNRVQEAIAKIKAQAKIELR